MYQETAHARQTASLIFDVACISLAFALAFVLRLFHDSLPVLGEVPSLYWTAERGVRSDYFLLFALNVMTWSAYLRRSGFYLSGAAERITTTVPTYLKALALCALVSGAMVFALKVSISRLFFAYFSSLALLMIFLKQVVYIALLRKIRRTGLHRRHVLVIGAATPAAWLLGVILNRRDAGYSVVGAVLTDGKELDGQMAGLFKGELGDLNQVLLENPVDEVFIVGSAKGMAQLAPVAQSLIEKGRVVSMVSALQTGDHGVCGRVTEFSGIPVISFGPMPKDSIQSTTKRAIDIATSAVALVLLSPLLLFIAVSIKVFDPGPVVFRQERVGLSGQRFWLYKFRSMRVDAEERLRSDPELFKAYMENDHKLPAEVDPRISTLGRFLRKWSLDELPQLWNVLKGEMALVGPRPVFPGQIGEYGQYADLFLSIRPGLTGHWQVSGRSKIRYPQRAFLDLDYVGRHSIGTDLSIIVRTVPTVLRRKGAF